MEVNEPATVKPTGIARVLNDLGTRANLLKEIAAKLEECLVSVLHAVPEGPRTAEDRNAPTCELHGNLRGIDDQLVEVAATLEEILERLEL